MRAPSDVKHVKPKKDTIAMHKDWFYDSDRSST